MTVRNLQQELEQNAQLERETSARVRNERLRDEIAGRVRAEEELRQHRDHLEELVQERTAELQREIAERMRVEQRIKASLAEKEVLLREVHHRVKNNLQVIIYLIDMQAETVEDPAALRAFGALQGRVRAMSLVHENLYQVGDLVQVDFGDYLGDLTVNLLHTLGGGRAIALHVDAADALIDVNVAIPCGLMVNELVTNALKHAFPEEDRDIDRDREIRVGFGLQRGEYVLVVSDNGVGLSPELDWRAGESLGLKMANVWATHQLGGSIELDSGFDPERGQRAGTAFEIRFPKRK